MLSSTKIYDFEKLKDIFFERKLTKSRKGYILVTLTKGTFLNAIIDKAHHCTLTWNLHLMCLDCSENTRATVGIEAVIHPSFNLDNCKPRSFTTRAMSSVNLSGLLLQQKFLHCTNTGMSVLPITFSIIFLIFFLFDIFLI